MTPVWTDLTGRRALVIGASRGLGKEAAIALAAAGADVMCAARSEEALAAVALEIAARGGRARARRLDASIEQDVVDGVAAATADGPLDILVYAAGVMQASHALQSDTADWDRLFRVNLTSGFVAAREAARAMKTRGGRLIFFSTSFVGRVLPMTVAYSASKAALQQMVQSLALEWARYGITSNAIAPGYFETDMPKAVLDDPQLRERILARIPARRFGQPAEIGPVVVFLASDAAAYMTGSILRIDGGHALHVT